VRRPEPDCARSRIVCAGPGGHNERNLLCRRAGGKFAPGRRPLLNRSVPPVGAPHRSSSCWNGSVARPAHGG